MLEQRLPKRHERATLRRLAYAGARHGPWFWLRYSPPFFGFLFALLLGGARRKVRENLRWVLGRRGAIREQIDVFRTFSTYASCLAEALAAGRPGRAPELEVSGEGDLERAIAAGRGVVLVTAHTGPWDAVAHLLSSRLSAKVLVVMQAEADAEALSFQDEIRARNGIEVLHVGNTPFDGLGGLRHLRAGGVVAFQLDRPAPSGRGLQTGLFGRDFAVPEGPFRLAALAGCPVIPVFMAREGFLAYRAEVLSPIEPAASRDEEGLLSAARAACRALEAFLTRYPTQWFHF
jgi:KDO2-lipid IV(A) lauroyltransferase